MKVMADQVSSCAERRPPEDQPLRRTNGAACIRPGRTPAPEASGDAELQWGGGGLDPKIERKRTEVNAGRADRSLADSAIWLLSFGGFKASRWQL